MNIFKKNPVFGMIHTGYSTDADMLELAQKEIGIYLRYGNRSPCRRLHVSLEHDYTIIVEQSLFAYGLQ